MLSEFCRQYGLPFKDLSLLKLALTHRSYLSVTGQGPRESNERLEFLGDSVLGLVTSEFLYRRHPDEHEGQLTKTKSLLVSKAILSRRALRIGLGRFVLMSHSEVESGGRQRLSILADAFESVIGAVYLDQGFESARTFIHRHLLSESDAITSDKRHTNYKSHLQEYVQNSFRTHPVYRIRSEYGPDHSKYFMVEVMVGKRTLGEGRGHNKKEAEQAAARDALEKVEKLRRKVREDDDREAEVPREHAASERSSSEHSSSEHSEHGSSERSERGSSERSERGSNARAARTSAGESRRDAAPERPRRSAAAPPPAPIHDADTEEEESEEGADSPRRRRSRRGGRGRHGREDAHRGARLEPEAERGVETQTMRLVEPASPAPPVVDDIDDIEDVEEPSPRVSFEPAYDSRLPSLDEVEPLSLPATPVTPVTPARPMSFGRGQRRKPLPAAPPAPAAADTAEAEPERRVDPYQTAAPAEEVTPPPVVDVAAEIGTPETDREREARIDEMEQALDNFGRRRSPDYGRRGRRR